MKKLIKKEVGSLDVDNSDAEYIIEQLQEMIAKYGVVSCSVEEYFYSTGATGDTYIAILAELEETDDECMIRTAHEKYYAGLRVAHE